MCLGSADSGSSNLKDIMARVEQLDENVRAMSNKSKLLVDKLEKPVEQFKMGLNSFIDFKKKLVQEHPDLDAGLRERIIKQKHYQVAGTSSSSQHGQSKPEPEDSASSLVRKLFEGDEAVATKTDEPDSCNEHELRMCTNIREFFQIYSPNVSYQDYQ